MSEPSHETCGFCGGNGFVHRSVYDCDGRQIYDEPPKIVCEYCAGTGSCEHGSILLPAPPREAYES